ncbi:MAG: ComEC family competence protein [Abditibacteriota bacterium]|nr:ComEC family competence protein [Abditibacteriota bacterium]
MKIIDDTKKLPELNIFLATVAFSLGIIISDSIPSPASWIILITIPLICCVTLKKKIIFFSLILLMGGLMCFSHKILPNDHIGKLDSSEINIVEGIICSDIEKHKNTYMFYLNCDRVFTETIHNCKGKIIVYLKCDTKLKRGDRIRLKGYFFSPTNYTEGEKFNYQKYLSRKNIYFIYSLKNESNLRILNKPKYPYFIDALRTYIINVFSNLNTETGNLLMGMVLGNGNYLDSNTYNNFVNTSTLHLLAASGLNCYVLTIFLWCALFFIEFRKKNIITTFLIWIYAALISFPASILRAALMCSLILLGKTFKIISSFKIIYFLSAFLLLLVNPSNLFDAGFQLSYLCLFAMIYVAGPTCNLTYKYIQSIRINDRFFRWIFRGVSLSIVLPIITTVSVYLIVGLVTVYYFEYISIIGVFANVLVGFLASVIFVASVIFLIIWGIPYVGDWGVYALNFIGKTILYVINTLGEKSFAAINVKSPNEYVIILVYIVLFWFFIFKYPKIIGKWTNKKPGRSYTEDEICKNLPDK